MPFFAFYPPPGGSTLAPGAATSANQVTEITELQAIHADLDALNARLPGGLVPSHFDEQDITYVGATDAINTVIYKLAGVTVATLTLGYDGSNRLTSVVKS